MYSGDSDHERTTVPFTLAAYVAPPALAAPVAPAAPATPTAPVIKPLLRHVSVALKITSHRANHLAIKVTAPGRPGRLKVLLQVLAHGRWVTIGHGTLASNGTVTVTGGHLKVGKTKVRVVVEPTATTTSVTSTTTVRIT